MMTDRTGQQLDDYWLLRLLGKGTFGEVYEGEHIYLKTHVAIKVLQARLDPGEFQHVIQEARTIAALEHPHIVRVLDFSVQQHTPYLVMQLAQSSLKERFPPGEPYPIEMILPAIQQAARGLQYAHNQQIMHLDIKPANLLVTPQQEVLLADFGLAMALQTQRTHQTVHGFAGTAAYAAPEQFQNQPGRASDQYALGMMVYEWLTGTLPFTGNWMALGHQKLTQHPSPLRARVFSISLAVENVVLQALATNPKERFASVQDFAIALEQAAQAPRDPSLQTHPLASPLDASAPRDGRREIPSLATPDPLTGHARSAAMPERLPTSSLSVPDPCAEDLSQMENPASDSSMDHLPPPDSQADVLTALAVSAAPNVRDPTTQPPISLNPPSPHGQLGVSPKVRMPAEQLAPFPEMNIASYERPSPRREGVQRDSSLSPKCASASPKHHQRYAPWRTLSLVGLALLVLLGGTSVGVYGVVTHAWPWTLSPVQPSPRRDTQDATAAARVYATNTAKGIMYGFDAAHTHWNPYETILSTATISTLKVTWWYATGGVIDSSPTVTASMVYIGSKDGQLYVFDATCRQNCHPLWTYTTGSPVDSSPAVAHGLLYVGSSNDELYTFDATCRQDCHPLWTYNTGGSINSSPTVANNMVYIGSYNHTLYAFDATCRQDCRPLWTYTTGGAIFSSPAIANGMLYVGSKDGKFYAFDATCKRACHPLWTYTTGGGIDSSPAVASGMVYVGSYDSKVYAFDATCKRACHPLWTYTTGRGIDSSPAVAEGMLYIGSQDGQFYAFDATCTRACIPLWTFTMHDTIESSPTVANNIVYVSGGDHTVTTFDATCRQVCAPLARVPTDGYMISSPAVANGMVYVGSWDHKVYALSTTR